MASVANVPGKAIPTFAEFLLKRDYSGAKTILEVGRQSWLFMSHILSHAHPVLYSCYSSPKTQVMSGQHFVTFIWATTEKLSMNIRELKALEEVR